jgi:hypothetical protein
MEIFNGKEFTLLLIIVLICLGLSACAIKGVPHNNPKLPEQLDLPRESTEPKTQTLTDSISKMEGVANALACMFAPNTCDTVKQEREMDR